MYKPKNYKNQLLSVIIVLLCTSLFGKGNNKQDPNNPVLLTLSGSPITVSEFKYIYEKNNSADKGKMYSEENIKNYMDLFINFKLKVKAAKDAGLDTTPAFKKEYTQYRNQLAQPYLIDKSVTEKIMEEAYNRMQYEVKAAHILISVSAEDPQKKHDSAIKVINRLRDSIVKGANFELVAKKFSQDPSAQYNGGDLGYFTAFQMIYDFETVAYNLQNKGDISQPVKTQFGYHIVILKDKRPYRGEVQVRHILINDNDKNTKQERDIAKAKIDSVYRFLKEGKKFEDLAKTYSDHQQSKEKGGEIGWFNSFASFPENMMDEAFALKNKGDYSKPFQTTYGWHIVQLMDKKGLKSRRELDEYLKQKIQRDSRSDQSKEAAINRFKQEYKFKEKSGAIKGFMPFVDESLLKGAYKPDMDNIKSKELFKLEKQKYTYQDFAKWLKTNQSLNKYKELQSAVNLYYKDFVSESIMQYADNKLEEKYEDFRNISNEYKEGILLFDITDKSVWSKATNDTIGQKKFFEANSSKYVWGERVDAVVYDIKPNAKYVDVIKDKKGANKTIEKPLLQALKEAIGKGDETPAQIANRFNAADPLSINIKEGYFERKDNTWVDKTQWQPGIWDMGTENGRQYIIHVKGKRNPEPKKLNEVKGVVISDYQDKLEKEWISSLRKKYTIEVDEIVLRKMMKRD